ncbi:hypothetical protein HDV57DRAFT_31874 [Trichoderma longibrachiatum]
MLRGACEAAVMPFVAGKCVQEKRKVIALARGWSQVESWNEWPISNEIRFDAGKSVARRSRLSLLVVTPFHPFQYLSSMRNRLRMQDVVVRASSMLQNETRHRVLRSYDKSHPLSCVGLGDQCCCPFTILVHRLLQDCSRRPITPTREKGKKKKRGGGKPRKEKHRREYSRNQK